MVDFKEEIVRTSIGNNGVKTVTTRFHESDPRLQSESIWTRTIEIDYNNDGKVDEQILETYSGIEKTQLSSVTRKFEYDERGNEIKSEYDYGSDGTIEETYTTEYDSKNRPIKQNLNNETIVFHKYNNNFPTENISIHSYDFGADNTIDHQEVITESKDYKDGNGVRRTVFYKADENGELKYDGHSIYGYDNNGQTIADHYNTKGFSHSTGHRAFEHPDGFGLK